MGDEHIPKPSRWDPIPQKVKVSKDPLGEISSLSKRQKKGKRQGFPSIKVSENVFDGEPSLQRSPSPNPELADKPPLAQAPPSSDSGTSIPETQQVSDFFNELRPEVQKKLVHVTAVDAYKKIFTLVPLLDKLPRGAIGDFPPFPPEINNNAAELDRYIQMYENQARMRLDAAERVIEDATAAQQQENKRIDNGLQPENWPIESYWIPSTDTLNTMPSYEARFQFFVELLHPERIPRVDTVHVGVLAPAGATVDANLARVGYMQPGQDILEEVRGAADFVRKDYEDVPSVEIVPWIEGSGITVKREEPNSLFHLAGGNGPTEQPEGQQEGQQDDRPGGRVDENGVHIGGNSAILSEWLPPNSKTNFPGVYFTDILDDSVFNPIKEFMVVMAKRPDIKEIVVDDHFGLKMGNPGVREQLVERHDLVNQVGTDVGKQNEWIRDRLTERIGELSKALKDEGVDLSVSVHAFDFDTGGDRLEYVPEEEPLTEAERQERSKSPNNWDVGEWDLALKLNLQDVARWIEGGFITGELNIQMSPGPNGLPGGLIGEDGQGGKYNDFIRYLREHLNPRRGDDLTPEYVQNFPEVSVSLYAEGTNWAYFGPKEKPELYGSGSDRLNEIVEYMNKPENSTIQAKYGRVIRVRVVGFDYLDFERVPRPTSGEPNQ